MYLENVVHVCNIHRTARRTIYVRYPRASQAFHRLKRFCTYYSTTGKLSNITYSILQKSIITCKLIFVLIHSLQGKYICNKLSQKGSQKTIFSDDGTLNKIVEKIFITVLLPLILALGVYIMAVIFLLFINRIIRGVSDVRSLKIAASLTQ